MPDFCAAYGCSNRRSLKTRARGITFHLFPKTGKMRRQWELALRRDGFVASDRTLLCSEHFRGEDFDRTGQNVRLKDGVVPSIFNFPSHLQRLVATRSTTTSRRAEDNLPVDLSQDVPLIMCESHMENSVCAATRSIIDTVIHAAVELSFSTDKPCVFEPGPQRTKVAMAEEATRKISSIFYHLLKREIEALETKVELLESQLKTTMENYEGAKQWRENVLSGSPVLFEQTGLVYTLKPLGKLISPSDYISDRTPEPAAAPQMQSTEKADTTVGAVSRKMYKAQNKEPAANKTRKSFKCNVCDKNFGRLFHLQKHMNTHRDQKAFACDQCSRKFCDPGRFEHHLLRHEEKRFTVFKCNVCEKTFKNKLYLRTHELLHTDTRPFICSTCGKAFKTKQYLNAHHTVHNEEKPHKCTDCSQSFRNAFALKCHERIHTGEHPYKCTMCDKAFKLKRSLKLHQSVHSGKIFTCEICGANFTFQQNLKRHHRIHTGERPFKCKICGKSFVQNKLKAHMLIHGATKTFMCDLCGRTFLYNFQLKRHQKQVHEKDKHLRVMRGQSRGRAQSRVPGNRRVIYCRDRTTVDVTPFSCKTCRRSFQDASALQKHELVHLDKKQYSCNLCEKNFFYKATYDYHLRVHSGERPFECDICGKSFIILQALKSHKLQHTGEKPHQCEHCGKAFRVHANYRKHLLIHSGEKPYECEVCRARFRQLTHVKFHMQVHTGERPYSCTTCGLGFSDSRLLKKHNCVLKQSIWTDLSQ